MMNSALPGFVIRLWTKKAPRFLHRGELHIMKMAIFILIGTLIAFGRTARADNISYDEIVTIEAQGSDFKIVHHHDWSKATRAKRIEMMNTHQDPFKGGNNYGYVAWYTREGKLLRKLPSPALTWLGVSPDSRYVIGLSKVMLDNPYQLVVWSRDGKFLVKRHIAPRVACLTPQSYRELRRSHATAFDVLRERVWTSGDVIYVDYQTKGMPERLGKLWGILLSKSCASPWSPNFSESVTNWIYWYDEADPAPAVVETAGKPSALRLKDPKGLVITVPFHLEAPGR